MAAPARSAGLRLAVLIDGENASYKRADWLFAEIDKLGRADLRRVYGDFNTGSAKVWLPAMVRHALTPMQQNPLALAKNSADIALVIDAMDLLHRHQFDGFCLVSSDSDFTRLAMRIREEGVQVFGFGRAEASESFQHACHRFFAIPADKSHPAKCNEPVGRAVPPAALSTMPPAGEKPKEPGKRPMAALKILRPLILEIGDADGWATLSAFGKALSALDPKFSPRDYGYAKLSALIKETGDFDLDTQSNGMLRLRRKAAQKKTA